MSGSRSRASVRSIFHEARLKFFSQRRNIHEASAESDAMELVGDVAVGGAMLLPAHASNSANAGAVDSAPKLTRSNSCPSLNEAAAAAAGGVGGVGALRQPAAAAAADAAAAPMRVEGERERRLSRFPLRHQLSGGDLLSARDRSGSVPTEPRPSLV